jgi:hypothetical protein
VQHVRFGVHHVAGRYLRHHSVNFDLPGSSSNDYEFFFGMAVRRMRPGARLERNNARCYRRKLLRRTVEMHSRFGSGAIPLRRKTCAFHHGTLERRTTLQSVHVSDLLRSLKKGTRKNRRGGKKVPSIEHSLPLFR